MENINQPNYIKMRKGHKARIFFAISLCLFVYGSYFYNLVREHYLYMVQKQSALESIKVIAVPGIAFLNNLGSLAILKTSLFYLILLGMMFLVFLLLSLLIKSPVKRGVFLLAGFFILVLLTISDRVIFSFSFILCISFASFYLLTLPFRIVISIREGLILLLFMGLISLALFLGSRNKFFLKTRDKILFDTTIGNRIVSFYYDYSPLATSLISLEQNVYEGIIFHNGIKEERPVYLGNGLFLSGNRKVKEYADFVISREGENYVITNRYGNKTSIASFQAEEIEKAISNLFTMKGFLKLNNIGLYFFPAGLLIPFLMLVKWLTDNKKVFILSGTGITTILILFIGYVSLTVRNPPKSDDLKSIELKREGLSIAYYLNNNKEIPEPYIPIVKKMARSESPSLRYWGAYLLGMLNDSKEVQTLIKLLNDPFLNVRYMAAQSLFNLSKEGSFGHLLNLLFTDPSWYVRCKVFSIFLNAGLIPSPVLPKQPQ